MTPEWVSYQYENELRTTNIRLSPLVFPESAHCLDKRLVIDGAGFSPREVLFLLISGNIRLLNKQQTIGLLLWVKQKKESRFWHSVQIFTFPCPTFAFLYDFKALRTTSVFSSSHFHWLATSFLPFFLDIYYYLRFCPRSWNGQHAWHAPLVPDYTVSDFTSNWRSKSIYMIPDKHWKSWKVFYSFFISSRSPYLRKQVLRICWNMVHVLFWRWFQCNDQLCTNW